MTTLALLLVLGSALCHASWNFLLKRSDHKVAFLWSLVAVSSVVFFAPAAVFIALDGITMRGIAFGLGTAALHGVYGVSLARGYQVGDLSAVYPISRGMGPALVPLFAVFLLDERASIAAGFGIALVVAGICVLNLESARFRDLIRPAQAFSRPATRIALLTGALIAAYTLWDKAALDHLSPVAVNQFAMMGHMLVLAPFALNGGTASVVSEWRQRRGSIVVAGLLAPLAYVLVLVALTTSRVSYVAPAREVGIVIGAALGVLLLGEGFGRWRMAGATLVLAGVLTLGVAP